METTATASPTVRVLLGPMVIAWTLCGPARLATAAITPGGAGPAPQPPGTAQAIGRSATEPGDVVQPHPAGSLLRPSPAAAHPDTAASTTAGQRRPRLGPLDPAAQALLAEALERSETVRDLSRSLEDTDLLVHVATECRTHGIPHIVLLGAAGQVRHLLISVPVAAPPASGQKLYTINQRISWLGHELHHALEIAEAGWVRDQRGMSQLFQQIGRRSSGGYETEGAQRVERAIAQELLK